MSIPVGRERMVTLSPALLGTAAPAAAQAAKGRTPRAQALCCQAGGHVPLWACCCVYTKHGRQVTTKKGRSSRWGAKTVGSSWHEVGIKNLPLLRTCLEKQTSASPLLTLSLATSTETVFIGTQASGIFVTHSECSALDEQECCALSTVVCHHLWSTRNP